MQILQHGFGRISAMMGLLSTAALLLGCGTGVTTSWHDSASAYGGSSLIHATVANGTNMTVIRQNPFAGDRSDDAVFNVVQASSQSRNYKFGRGQPPADWNGHTLMLTFADGVLGNSNLCKSADQPLLPAPAGKTAIVADYCLGNVLVAEVKGSVVGATGPDDPKFKDLISGIMSEMFLPRPQKDSGMSGGCSGSNC